MFLRIIRKVIREWKWKRDPIQYARSLGVKVGEGCRFVGLEISTFGSEPYLIQLGNHVMIASGVQFITHDGAVSAFPQALPNVDIVAPIRVGNNVAIGFRAIILPGVTIGDNCIIGVGSVVTKNIPSGSFAIGMPARVIKSVDDYIRESKASAFYTRNLSPVQKREFFEKEFFNLNR